MLLILFFIFIAMNGFGKSLFYLIFFGVRNALKSKKPSFTTKKTLVLTLRRLNLDSLLGLGLRFFRVRVRARVRVRVRVRINLTLTLTENSGLTALGLGLGVF